MYQVTTKLLEVAHGQWLYRNEEVHQPESGLLQILCKEEIQHEIEIQLGRKKEGLLEEDQYLTEINLDDLTAHSRE
jgi:hypothetical protein